ncbi:MAG: sialidase family protein [Bryobacteraceae bacterium]
MEGHRGVEMGICITYYSDDEGKTWKQSEGGLFGWFDEKGEPNGAGGILDLYEPTSAETKDGRVLFIARSNGGVTWHSVQPTQLSSSQSPALLIRIPKTGDLLCVWNQVSAEEIRRGFLRGRLSSAVSTDSGMTWRHFKTLELQDGMDDVGQIAPEFPIPRRLVARPGLGQLPDGFAMFTYPNVDIVGDKVFVRYSRMWPRVISGKPETKRDPNLPLMWPQYEEREAEMTGESILRIYPLDWFYR